MTLSSDAKAFVTEHQAHGQLTCDAGEVTPMGYDFSIACPCGARFERWVTEAEAVDDLAAWAELN